MTGPLRILVTGSRHWSDHKVIRRALLDALDRYPYTEKPILVHGDASGADAVAGVVWRGLPNSMQHATGEPPLWWWLGLVEEKHPADWRAHGKAAGPIRNQEMVDAAAAICLAFPLRASIGTRDCMRRAARAGIPVINYGDEAA